MPLTAGGNPRKRSGGVKPLTPEKPHFAQGGETHSGGGFAPPVRPPSPNQTFADGLTRRDQDEPPDPDPRWPPVLNPADAILTEEVYPTADWPGHLPMPADIPAFDSDIADRSPQALDPVELPDILPDDSVSQAGQKPPQHRQDLDLEDYRQDHGSRQSLRKTERRRNHHRSEQNQHRHAEYQKRRITPNPIPVGPADPPFSAVRARSDPGPPPTPAPSPPPSPSARTRRASKRQSKADSPNPLCSEQAIDRRLGRSPAKMHRLPLPPLTGTTAEDDTPDRVGSTETMPANNEPADKPQEVLFINQSGRKTKKSQGPGTHRENPPMTRQGERNDVFFRCRENLDFPAVNRARDIFIPVELHFRQARALTDLELEKACVADRKVILLHWNRSFQIKRKVHGVHHWFQHNRRCDSGFPFSPGAAACIRVPKNVHVKVRAGCRLGSVVAVEDVGLERLPEEDEDEDDLSNLNPPPHPPMDRHNAHNR